MKSTECEIDLSADDHKPRVKRADVRQVRISREGKQAVAKDGKADLLKGEAIEKCENKTPPRFWPEAES